MTQHELAAAEMLRRMFRLEKYPAKDEDGDPMTFRGAMRWYAANHGNQIALPLPRLKIVSDIVRVPEILLGRDTAFESALWARLDENPGDILIVRAHANRPLVSAIWTVERFNSPADLCAAVGRFRPRNFISVLLAIQNWYVQAVRLDSWAAI